MSRSAHFAVARAVLQLGLVRRILLTVVLCLGLAGVAMAGEVDDRLQKIAQLSEKRAKADQTRVALEKQYAAKTKEIDDLKAQRSSWSRDDKLKKRGGEARDMSAALDQATADEQAVDAAIQTERAALVKAIDAELAGSPDAARKAKLARARADATAHLGTAKIHIDDEDEDKLDDPDDLDAKARALAASEQQLAEEEQRLDARAAYYEKQAKLTKANSRSKEDIFGDEQSRRKNGSTSRTAVDPATDGTHGGGVQQPAGPQPPPTGAGDFASEGGKQDLSADPSVVYAEVVDPATLDELRKAERSGDPASRAKAAKRARADLQARHAKLTKKRQAIEKRAREMRDRGE